MMNTKQDRTMSRRAFLSSALLASARVAGTTALAGCAPKVAGSASGTLAETGAANDGWMGSEPTINDDEIVKELEAE